MFISPKDIVDNTYVADHSNTFNEEIKCSNVVEPDYNDDDLGGPSNIRSILSVALFFV